MDQGNRVVPEEVGSELVEFIQRQIQTVFQSAIPHLVQQISERATALPAQISPSTAVPSTHQDRHRVEKYELGVSKKESKVAEPEKFTGKRSGEVYRWFAQLRLVFRGKPRTYQSDEDKIAYALSYMSGAAQNWAMPLLQALDEGRSHELLSNYDAFRAAIIGVYGDIDRKGNAEDRLGKIKQTGSAASYISSFNEHAAQVDWNEASLVARFRSGLKDEILDSVATAEVQPRGLQDWMAMTSRIDERLWVRRQTRRSSTSYSNSFPVPQMGSKSQQWDSQVPTSASKDHGGRFQSTPELSGPVPMELGAVRVTTALAKTPAERLDYQRQGRCWGCGLIGHVRARCPTNPSKPLSLSASEFEPGESGKGTARD